MSKEPAKPRARDLCLPFEGETGADNAITDFDDLYRAVVQAIEEAMVNAMIAAESMTTVKPEGYTLEAIDHGRLKQIMKQH
jgi:L-aminopeptidase/D-esterase-like protein